MTAADTPLPAATRVGRVALRVNDLDRLAEFYRSVVGLDVLDRGDGRATLGAGDEPLFELIAAPEVPERGPEETGLFHTAFRFPSRAALGDALRRVRGRWRLDGASDHLVSEALYLTDPEGNGVELYRDRPEERWPIAEDGGVEMETLSLDTGAIADRASGEAGAPEGTTVGHVHIEVSSLSASRAFYADVPGMAVRQALDGALFLAAGGYHHHVGLNTWNGRTAPPAGRGLAWFELLVSDSDSFEAARDRFSTAGVGVEDENDVLAAGDPDGIELRVRTDG